MCPQNHIATSLTTALRPFENPNMTRKRSLPHGTFKTSQFARSLLANWRRLKLPTARDPIVIGVSGGADSIALLLALDELKKVGKLSPEIWIAHLDHGLRDPSKRDAQWVSELAKRLGYPFVLGRKKVREIAESNADNLEQSARTARYEFLEKTARRKRAQFVLTAHTMDDQAETVMMRLMRGSSGLGLGGIEAVRALSKDGKISLVRPLLWARRSETEDYCRHRKQEFLVDEMNVDERYSRVKVRRQLLPLMESFNSRVVEALSRTATLLREDGAVLQKNAVELLKNATVPMEARNSKTKTPVIDVQVLSRAPAALRRRALRQWIADARGNARRLEMAHLVAVERLLEGEAGGRVAELPNGARVRRKRGRLEFEVEND
jgi:tRNA(Ile)-lysidine synthase